MVVFRTLGIRCPDMALGASNVDSKGEHPECLQTGWGLNRIPRNYELAENLSCRDLVV